MSRWLSPDEVAELTDYRQHAAQCRALAAMGYPFKVSRVGRPLVESAAVMRYRSKPERHADQPDFDALNRAA